MSSAVPAIPLFGDAYLADTRHLSLEEHGAYLQLIMIAWRIEGCRLPDDDSRLSRMLGTTAAKWRKLKPVVMAFWTLENGYWTQTRLSKERKFVEEKRAKNKASADARWGNQPVEIIEGDECERISERNAPPPSPPVVREETETNVSVTHTRKPDPFPRPDWADKQHWADFLGNRKAKRLRNTPTAYAGFLRDIDRLTDDEWPPGRLLEYAAAKGWGSINQPAEGSHNGQHGQANRGNGQRMGGPRPDPTLALVRAAHAAQRQDGGDPRGVGLALPPG